MATQTVAAKLTIKTTWPASGSIFAGMGDYDLWELSTMTVDSSNKITLSTRTCQTTQPPIALNSTGQTASGCTGPCQVGTISPPSEWDDVKRASTQTGTLGGWNVGSSYEIDSGVTLDGLPESSTYKDLTTKWPPASTTGYPFGNPPVPTLVPEQSDYPSIPGIDVLVNTASGFADIKGGLGGSAPPLGRLFVASRTALSMSGTSVSCTETDGTVTTKALDTHIVGCTLADDAGACMPSNWGFIDGTRTIYIPGTGTFKQIVVPDSSKCEDVVMMLP